MKKILSILLAAMMLISLFTVPAFAYDIDKVSGNGSLEGAAKEDFHGSTSADVKIQINGDINHRYAVDITFTAPVFTFSSDAVWHPDTHEYSHDASIDWAGTGVVVVENHSDMPITYAAEAEVTATQYGDLDIVFNGAATYAPIPATEIPGCTVGGTAPSEDFTYGVVGMPIVGSLPATKLGTVTVTVAPAN